ncbi:hypothetical protein CLU97_3728 [Chryseobacterium sp. 7]|nr:hypothetical protein CLU97_3728 [Chryseobacterium sp. 7]
MDAFIIYTNNKHNNKVRSVLFPFCIANYKFKKYLYISTHNFYETSVSSVELVLEN